MPNLKPNYQIYFWPLILNYYRLVFRYWPHYLLYLGGLAGLVLLVDITIPWLLKESIDLLSAAIESDSALSSDVIRLWNDVFYLFYWVALALLLGIFFKVALVLGVTNSQPWALRDLELQALKTLLQKPYDFYASNLVGALTAKVKRYSDSMLAFDYGMTRGLWVIFIQYIAAISVVTYYSPLLASVFVIWSLVFILLSRPLMVLKGSCDRQYGDADSKAVGGLADTLGNYLSVKAFSQQQQELRNFSDATALSVDFRRRSWFMSARLELVQGSTIVGFQILLLALSLRALQHGEISLGTLILVQAYLLKVGSNLTELGVHAKEMFRAIASASDMYAIIQDPQTEYEPITPRPSLVSKGALEFNMVSFAYDSKQEVLSDFNLKVEPGQRIALVGASGAGKTTIIKLLLRFHRPQLGGIFIDGQNIDELSNSDLMACYSLVPQETFLFHRTVKDNICFGTVEPPSTSELKRVLHDSYLEEVIDKLPAGLDQIVGERGVKLSGGERQRIAIARAMLKPAPILILDEATNSLDASSEYHVQLALENLMRGRTSIIIAHKLSTIAGGDRILVMQAGRIVEEGRHQSLLDRRGEYFALWQDQQRGV